MLPSTHQPVPFKLTPVLPPRKNKVSNVNLSAQSEISQPNKQLVVSTTQTQPVTSVSSNRNPASPELTVGMQVDDEAMMLEDEAIVSMMMISAPTIGENSKPVTTNALTLSTRDESSDLSLGEKIQATVELKESISENLPNVLSKTTPDQLDIYNGLSSTTTTDNQGSILLRVEQSIERSEATSTSINSVEVGRQGEIGDQPDEPNPSYVVLEAETRHLENQFKIRSTQEYLPISNSMNQLETSVPSTRDNHQVVTRGKDGPTDRNPQPSV